jgi:hypothetical protein
MKNTIYIIIFLSFFSIQAFAQNDQLEEVVVPLSKPGSQGHLEVSVLNGSIIVTGTKGKEVIIRASGGDARPSRAKDEVDGLKRVTNNSLGLEVTERDNDVRIKTEAIHRIVNLEILVPQNFNLKISSVNKGNIEIRNVSGDFELNNVNGSIIMENISGSALANTINGKIKAVFTDWNNKSPMAFSTLNGEVDITLPANAKFTAKFGSDRGEVYTDFEIVKEKTQPVVNKKSDGGLYKVTIEDLITGKVNGGGPEIMIKNMNGNIYVRKKK